MGVASINYSQTYQKINENTTEYTADIKTTHIISVTKSDGTNWDDKEITVHLEKLGFRKTDAPNQNSTYGWQGDNGIPTGWVVEILSVKDDSNNDIPNGNLNIKLNKMKAIVVGLGVQGKKRKKFLGKDFIFSVDKYNKADFKNISEVPLKSYDSVYLCTPDNAKLKIIDFCIKNKKT